MRKITISTRFLTVLIIILTFYTVNFSQIETFSVPAKWEYYSGKDPKVSFLMPRLPVYVPSRDHCEGEMGEIYAAYNDGVVYYLEVISRIEPPKLCFQKKEFDENNFTKRLKFLKSELKDESKSENNISPDSVIKLVGNNRITRLVNDFKNKRWFELTVFGDDETKTEVKNFLASLKYDSQPAGIAIGAGTSQTFGDVLVEGVDEAKNLYNVIANDKETLEETVTDVTIKIKDTTEKKFIVALKQKRLIPMRRDEIKWKARSA
jgi:hypothetical protein